MTSKQKKVLVRIIVSAVIFAALMIFEHTVGFEIFTAGGYEDSWRRFIEPALFLIPYLIAGYDILIEAVEHISHGQVFDEDFLMIVASIGAYGVGEYSEAAAVMIFFQVGELFEGYAVGKSRKSISDLMDIAAEYANLEKDGSVTQVDPDSVEIGSVIIVRPGERVPLDGRVLEGDSYVDTSALTGESVPRHIKAGEDIISGCINGSGTLRCVTTKSYDDSTVSRILELVENASSKKSKTENFITKFARYYTPIVTISAVLLAIIPSLITGQWAEWIKRACTFLVISCPCALVISVPMGFFGGIGAASRIGVLVKGSNYLEAVANIGLICFDKTGTLTKGVFEVKNLIPAEGFTEEKLLAYAAAAEQFSTHPIALSIAKAYSDRYPEGQLPAVTAADISEISGHGLSACIGGEEVFVGNASLLKDRGIEFTECSESGTICYVSCGSRFMGALSVADMPKDGIREDLDAIRAAGVNKCVMLTGDRKAAAAAAAEEIGVDEFCSDLLPQNKVAKVEEYLKSCDGSHRLAFVGDGINDAPVLSRADVGIAMGSMGSDSAIEAADIVIMDDDIGKIAAIVRVARGTLRIVRQNIVFALAVKFAVLILGALGLANMWLAVFADVGVAVLAILNSMRALKLH